MAEVEAACAALRSPVVYCHNDLLAPNLLLEERAPRGDDAAGADVSASASASALASEASEPALHIIDFEYGGYNYRGFDLGNHFNEWAGFDCDYSRCVIKLVS